jgi:hypothetical protein
LKPVFLDNNHPIYNIREGLSIVDKSVEPRLNKYNEMNSDNE